MTQARKDAPLELLPHVLPPVFAADALAIAADVGREFGRRPSFEHLANGEAPLLGDFIGLRDFLRCAPR